MILTPSTIALLLSSGLGVLMLLGSAWYAINILRHWDLSSGSELQLSLERRTYLISTLLAYTFIFEIASLFLLVHTAECLHTLFVGAMCAAGTFYAHPMGYPALLFKLLFFTLAGIWLVINHLDNKAPDYPLIKFKYAYLLFLIPIAVAAAVTLWSFLLGIRADVITSCCGTLFSSSATEVSQEIGSFETFPITPVFIGLSLAIYTVGIFYYKSGRGGILFLLLSALMLPSSMTMLINIVAPYIYELPTHRCPFCILQSDYHYIGYPIYASLLLAVVTGVGAGALAVFCRVESLKQIIPATRAKLTITSLISYAIFITIISYAIITSNLINN